MHTFSTPGCFSILKAVSRSLTMGPSVVRWFMVGGSIRSFLKATTGFTSPFMALTIASAASTPLSYMSTCGLVS